jgi:hypothetical protein
VVDVSVVPFISPTARLVLLAVLVYPKCYGRKYARTREVYAEYARLSAIADVKPVTYRRFGTIVRQLEEMGVIERSVWSVGRYGKMSVLKVIEPERVWKELKEDLALGEVVERLCSDFPMYLPSGDADMAIGKMVTIMDSANSMRLEYGGTSF